jgi:hypothetical protein
MVKTPEALQRRREQNRARNRERTRRITELVASLPKKAPKKRQYRSPEGLQKMRTRAKTRIYTPEQKERKRQVAKARMRRLLALLPKKQQDRFTQRRIWGHYLHALREEEKHILRSEESWGKHYRWHSVSAKVCKICASCLPIEEFYLQSGTSQGSGRRYNLCKKCFNKSLHTARWGDEERRAQLKASMRAWKKAHPERNRLDRATWRQRHQYTLSDLYIKHRLRTDDGFERTDDIPPELIELKRLQIQIYREINNQNGGDRRSRRRNKT